MKRFLLLVALSGSACVRPEVEPQFVPAYEPFDPHESDWRTTRPVLLVSDTQLFNLYTLPVPERNLSAQTLVPTAIRSPQLNLFSSDVLRWILADREVEVEGVLHLGDAVDLACEGEFETFVEIMSHAGRPWLMAPGNHDCYYFGNYDPEREEIWNEGCYDAIGPLRKNRFVRLYVAALLQQQDPGFALLAESLGLEGSRARSLQEIAALLPSTHRFEAPADSQAFLTGIVWNIDDENPWRSFVLQRVDLSGRGANGIPAVGFLLDSCQYERRPAMLPNAWHSYPVPLNVGFTGELLADQLRALRVWIEPLQQGRIVAVLMCHHPINTLAPKSLGRLAWLVTEYPAVGMAVTAHTHSGHYEYHQITPQRQIVELNVGSTTDWPMEWRTLQTFFRVRDGKREIYLQSHRFTLAERLRNREGYFQAGWEVPYGELDDYRVYRQGQASFSSITDIYLGYHLKPPFFGPARLEARPAARATEAKYKVGLLLTYDRLVRLFPTDAAEAARWPSGCSNDADVRARIAAVAKEEMSIEDKIALLVELDPFERTRRTRDPLTGEASDDVRARFKLSQAVWASRYEYTRGRTLQPEDELVRVNLPEEPPAQQP